MIYALCTSFLLLNMHDREFRTGVLPPFCAATVLPLSSSTTHLLFSSDMHVYVSEKEIKENY